MGFCGIELEVTNVGLCTKKLLNNWIWKLVSGENASVVLFCGFSRNQPMVNTKVKHELF